MRGIWIAGAVAGLLVLAGCTPAPTTVVIDDATSPAITSTPVPPKATPTPGSTAPADPALEQGEAVLVFASLDRDGQSVSISGYVKGPIEDGGLCTFHLTKAGTTVTRTTEGLSDAATTSCGTVSIPLTELSSGIWEAGFTYLSAVSAATSADQEVEIP